MLCALICGTCIVLLQIAKTRAMKLSCSKFFKVLFSQQLSNLLHSTKLIFKVAKGIFTGCTCTGLPFYIYHSYWQLFTVSHIVTIFHCCYGYSSYCHACHLLCTPFIGIFHCYTLVPHPVAMTVFWRGWEELESWWYKISLISSYLELDHMCATWKTCWRGRRVKLIWPDE